MRNRLLSGGLLGSGVRLSAVHCAHRVVILDDILGIMGRWCSMGDYRSDRIAKRTRYKWCDGDDARPLNVGKLHDLGMCICLHNRFFRLAAVAQQYAQANAKPFHRHVRKC